MSELNNLHEAIITMPLHILNGEYASTKHNIYQETEYDAIGWMLHKAGVGDKELMQMEGYISDARNMDKVWILLRTYGLSRMDARYIEETADHKSRKHLEEVLQLILREKKQIKQREDVA